MCDSRLFQTAQSEHLNERSRKTKKQTTRQKKESAHAHTFYLNRMFLSSSSPSSFFSSFFVIALIVLFSFVLTPISAEVISEIACETNTVALHCGTKLIKIIHANYGRTDSETCPMEGNADASTNTACLSTSAFNYVKDSCHGTQSCEMTASNSNFGDTCLRTYKYLNVTYECVPDWPIVLSKDGTVGVINGVGEVHVSASEMKVYGNMNVSEGDINIGGYGLSRFNSRIEDIENATETLLQLQIQLENNIKRPPYCMSPSADGLQHDGTDWICACRDGWSGTSCEYEVSMIPLTATTRTITFFSVTVNLRWNSCRTELHLWARIFLLPVK